MNIKERVKGIILNPAKEWTIIKDERLSASSLLSVYVVPLTLIPVISGFIGYGLVGQNIPFVGHFGSVSFGLRHSVMLLINTIAGIYITAWIINQILPFFSVPGNFDRAFRLVSYSYTPVMVSGFFYVLPSLSVVVMLSSVYSLYLLYTGLKTLTDISSEKKSNYIFISLVIALATNLLISVITRALIVKPAIAMP